MQSPTLQNTFADSAGKSSTSQQASNSKKAKLKINSRYSNTGANLMKIENLYQVSGTLNQSVEGNDEKKEIQMDHPRLKIFRFKHHKTSLEGE
jgi:hypothetical protein